LAIDGMLDALGAPPHGGIAPGIDRIVMLLCGEEYLREVVLFPRNQRAEDLMMGAPSEVLPKQLHELHIRVVKPSWKRASLPGFGVNRISLPRAPQGDPRKLRSVYASKI
jgi:hypothetical protein